tara:strand:+ start:292 stop:660 length:369 start_codon:yes stop_codon:yes gene_type:complete
MVRSLLITAAVSVLFAFGLEEFIGFWNTFSLVTGIQFVTFWIINSRQQIDKDSLYSEFETNIDDLLALSRVSVECPCTNHVFNEEVFMNSDNIHRCPKCNNNIKLDAQVRAILQTEPEEVTG